MGREEVERFFDRVDHHLCELIDWGSKHWKILERDDGKGAKPLRVYSVIKVVLRTLKEIIRKVGAFQELSNPFEVVHVQALVSAVRGIAVEGKDEVAFRYAREQFLLEAEASGRMDVGNPLSHSRRWMLRRGMDELLPQIRHLHQNYRREMYNGLGLGVILTVMVMYGLLYRRLLDLLAGSFHAVEVRWESWAMRFRRWMGRTKGRSNNYGSESIIVLILLLLLLVGFGGVVGLWIRRRLRPVVGGGLVIAGKRAMEMVRGAMAEEAEAEVGVGDEGEEGEKDADDERVLLEGYAKLSMKMWSEMVLECDIVLDALGGHGRGAVLSSSSSYSLMDQDCTMFLGHCRMLASSYRYIKRSVKLQKAQSQLMGRKQGRDKDRREASLSALPDGVVEDGMAGVRGESPYQPFASDFGLLLLPFGNDPFGDGKGAPRKKEGGGGVDGGGASASPSIVQPLSMS